MIRYWLNLDPPFLTNGNVTKPRIHALNMDISDFDIISDVFEKLIFLFTVIDECSTCKMTILYMN